MNAGVVITGIGLVTPLGGRPKTIHERIRRGDRAARPPAFDSSPYDCQLCAPVDDFNAEACFPDNKTLRLMNRDGQMAVVAARLAMNDANVRADETYSGEDIALFGATGLTGLPVREISRLVKLSAGPDGSFDLGRFGSVALKRVRPVLSFKILANMPICFVSIFESIRGENAIYTPWEGQGAWALAAGVRAIRAGRAACALVGGCDVKTHELSFISLQQLGVFDGWRRHGRGVVPGEGAAFLVLEDEERATARRARIYARVRGFRFAATDAGRTLDDVLSSLASLIPPDARPLVVGADAGECSHSTAEARACRGAGIEAQHALQPKLALGDLFAAAAPAQVALAAQGLTSGPAHQVALARCFGHGSMQAAFLLEAP
jgi:3-oxoacyl-(acyl-carrier-protein) synthase